MKTQTYFRPTVTSRPSMPGPGRRLLAVLAVLAVLLPGRALAVGACTGTGYVYFQPRILNYIGTQDGLAAGQAIAGDGQWDYQGNANFFYNASGYCVIRSVVGQTSGPAVPVPGVTYTESGKRYQVFQTNVAGVGYIMAVHDGDGNWRDITSTTGIEMWNYSPARTALDLSLRFKYVAYARLSPGSYLIPGRSIYQVLAFDAQWQQGGATLMGSRALAMRDSIINITARGCSIISGNTRSVSLPPVAQWRFNGVGATPGGASPDFSFNLACDPDVRVKAVMTDASDPTNTSDRLKLAIGSTATGVGVQVFHSDNPATPLSFGPDSPAAGTTNQWHVGESPPGSTGNYIPVTLRAGYVQTSPTVTPGTVKAAATITFSYQ